MGRELYVERFRLSAVCLWFPVWITAVTPGGATRHRCRLVLVRADRRIAHARRLAGQLRCTVGSDRIRRSGSPLGWCLVGGLITMFGVREKPRGQTAFYDRRSPSDAAFFQRVDCLETPQGRIGRHCRDDYHHIGVRFSGVLPIFFIHVVGFSLQQWLQGSGYVPTQQWFCHLSGVWVGLNRLGEEQSPFARSADCALTRWGFFYGHIISAAQLRVAKCWQHGLRHGAGRFRTDRSHHGLRCAGKVAAAAMSIMNPRSGMSTFIASCDR